MTSFTFSKLIPGGNPTIILHDPALPVGALPETAAQLMHPLHLGAEQVGALYVEPGPLPRLEMMGGEFCVNATRAAGLLLARQGLMRPLACEESGASVWLGGIEVSGATAPVRLLVSTSAQALERKIAGFDGHLPEGPGADCGPEHWGTCAEGDCRLFCAALVEGGASGPLCERVQQGVCLVRLPGISHLLVDARRHALPDMASPAWRKESEAFRHLCGLAQEPACGVVWYERDERGFCIHPAVAVRATGSEHMESACGSASLALALALRGGEAGYEDVADDVDVRQPSGQYLRVTLCRDSAPAAWISGPVQLAAQGTLWL